MNWDNIELVVGLSDSIAFSINSSTSITPIIPNYKSWEHNFDLSTPFFDSSRKNNNLINKKSVPNIFSYYHNFDSNQPLIDLSSNANNLIERFTDSFTPFLSYYHNFDINNPFTDQSTKNNNLIETIIDLTISYTPVNKTTYWSSWSGFMLSPDLSILGHDRNQIIWQVSSNNNMSGATEYTTNSYTFQNPTVPIFQNGIEITSYVPPGVFLAPLAVGTYYMRFRIGQSNWSDIIQVSILPPPIF